ncbi:MAG: tetratricopeptide repeat protein [Magnetococcales bacterium]|nr:tetratricopeptide repeat protein [Magnetococcales bacterium]
MNDADPDIARLNRSLALGIRLLESNRLNEAEELLSNVLKQYPQSAEGWHQAGLVAFRLGDGKLALDRVSHAINLNPLVASYHSSLGSALWQVGRKVESQTAYLQAITLDPKVAQYHSNHGLASLKLGQHQTAISSLLKAIQLDKQLVSAWIFLGETLEETNRLDEALNAFTMAYSLNPDAIDGVFGLVIVLIKKGQNEKADGLLNSLLNKYPENPRVYYKKGLTQRELGCWSQADAYFKKAVELNPNMAAARWNLTHMMPGVMETKEEYPFWRYKMSDRIDTLQNLFNKTNTANKAEFYKWVGGTQSFYLAYHLENNLLLLKKCGAINTAIMSHWAKSHSIQQLKPVNIGLTEQRPIRLGIVSSSIRFHSVWNAFLAGIVYQLDPERFSILLFHTDNKRDEVTKQAIVRCDSFIEETTIEKMAPAILKCKPDILLYADLGLKPINEQLASLRLAEVQITTWGHPDTSGRSTIDYFLSGELLEPQNGDDHYNETLIRVPNLGCFIEPTVTKHDKPQQIEKLFGQNNIDPTNQTIYISPHAPFKYPAAYDFLYPRIATEIKNARFIFFNYFRNPILSNQFKKRLLKAFANHELDGEKFIHFLPWQNQQNFHALLSLSHIYLDTCGFSGFNTALQGCECGLPVVTLEGPALRHRLASGLLHRINIKQTVANSPDDWLKIAIKLGEDIKWRNNIVEQIKHNLPIVYRDNEPIEFLNNFLEKTVREPDLLKNKSR